MKLKGKKLNTLFLIPVVIAVFAIAGFVLYKSRKQPQQETSPQILASLGTPEQIHAKCEAPTAPSDKFDCYAQTFKTFMEATGKANGGRATLTLLDSLQKLGGYANINCHPLSHKVGNIAFDYYGSVPAAVPQYLPTCSSGYYHGLLEEYLSTAPDYFQGIKVVCGTTHGGPEYFDWFQCTHGLGHGVMEYRNDEIPQALKDCDTIDPAYQAHEICYAGVFMENITTDVKTGHASKYIKPDDPIYPCDFVDTQYKNACYFLSSSMILRLNNWNFQDAFHTCDTRAEKSYVWLCYESMGRDISGSTLMDKTQVSKLCQLGSADMIGECFFGAVRDFINYQGQFNTAVDLCNYTPTQYQEKCYSGIFLDLGLYHKGQDFLNVCATMPDHFKAECDQKVVS
jgi:hypothetical protein